MSETETKCSICGATEDLRAGICFDCASKAERSAAARTPEQHIQRGLERLEIGDIEVARIYFQWALERLTGTGDYAIGGTFDAEYPGWRNVPAPPSLMKEV